MSSEFAPVSRWDLSGCPRREVDERLRDLGRTAKVPIDMHTALMQARAHFRHMRRNFDNVGVTDTEFDNFLCTRTSKLARDAAPPQLIVSVPSSGVRFAHGDRAVVAGERSLITYWSNAPWQLEVSQAARTRTFTMPLDDVGLPHLLLRELVGRDIGASPLAGLVSRHLTDLIDLPEVEVGAARSLGRPSVDLVRALLSLAAGEEHAARGALHRTLALRIVAHLTAHLHDATLSAESVASRFGISRRYLYVVLAQAGITLGEWVRDQRMRRAAEALRDPALVRMPVAAIVRRVGFRDHSSFSRAFRQAYGCSPSDWRER